MSDKEGKGDSSTSGVSENIKPPDESALPTDDAENIIKSSKLGVEVTKKDEIDENLITIDSGTVENSNIVDTNLKSDTFAKGDQIFQKTASELSKTTSVEATYTSKGTIDEPQTMSSDTNEQKTEKDDKILKQDHITSNPDINALLSQKNIPKDSTPNIEIDKTKKEEKNVAIDTPFDLNSSCDDDLELKWEDDENGDDYSTNLSEEALKLLDKELGIDDKVTNIEINTEIADDIIKLSTDTAPMEVKEHKLIVEDLPVKIEETAESVAENINSSTKKTLPYINQSTDKSTDITEKDIKETGFNENNDVKSSTKSEITEPDINSEVFNEETTVSSSNIPTDIVEKDEIVGKNEKMEDFNKQNEPEPIPDKELASSSNTDNVEDVNEPQMSRKFQITDDIIEMDTNTPNIAANSKITQNVEEMDVDVSENANKIELVDNPVEITKQSSIVEQESQIKIDEDIQEKTFLTDTTDIEMTEVTNPSLKDIESLENIGDNTLQTENESDLSILEVPIDEEGKVVTNENVENIKAQIPTTKLNEKEVLAVTKGMKTDLGLNKPDVMLEIPTQELIDIDDFEDSLEMDKEIIDSEECDETNTSTLETKTLLEEHTVANDKNTKSTTEQQNTTTQSEKKDITVTELVKIVTEKGKLIEITEKLDKNDLKIDDNVDNPSDDSVPECNSKVNDDEITEVSSSKVSNDNLTDEPIIKIDDDNVMKEPLPKTTDSNLTDEPISKSIDPTEAVDETAAPISAPNDDCMTDNQSSHVNNSHSTKETSQLNDNLTAEVSIENLNVAEITCKSKDENMTEETSRLDQNIIYETVSTPNDSNMAVAYEKITKESPSIEDMMTEIFKNTEEATKENPKTLKLEEDTTAEPISKSSIDDNMTTEVFKGKKSSHDIIITAEPDKESPDDESMTEPSKDKESSSVDVNITESSKDKKSSDDVIIIAEPSKDKVLSDDIIITAEPSKDKESLDDDSITAEPSRDKEASDDIIITAEPTKDKVSSSVDDNMTEVSKDKESDEIIITAEPSKDKESPLNDNKTKVSSPNTTETISKVDDDIAEDPEISDSLNLLAESSRVMEDDDQDEEDDSDDFDHDDESSNLQTAEHSEESNPPSDEAQPTDKNIALPDKSILKEDTIICNEDTKTSIDIVYEETDKVEIVAATVESSIESATLGNEIPQDEPQLKVKESLDKKDDDDDGGVLKKLLLEDNNKGDSSKKSQSKSTKLSISKEANIMTYVDLEESSDDDIEEINKEKSEEIKEESGEVAEEKIVEEEKIVKEKKPKFTLKMTKLNTSEVTIKTGLSSIPPLIIPEITNVSEIEKSKEILAVETNHCLEEVYSLDSDSDEEDIETSIEDVVQRKFNPKCINGMCDSSSADQHYVADAAAMRHYGATKRRAICAPCLASVDTRNEELIKGIKDLRPLLELNMEKAANQLVEISDSESDDESDLIKECNEFIGQEGAKVLNEKLADIINDVWQKYNMDDRLKDSEYYINGELIRLEDEGTELNKLLDDCQMETDRIRNDLYSTFESNSKSLLTLTIFDTPTANYTCIEKDDSNQDEFASPYLRSALEEPPAKRQNVGPPPNDTETPPTPESAKQADDDRDVSVVLLSAESAPDDLPPPGEVVRPPLRVGMHVHAMRNAFGSWLKGRILDIQPKVPGQPYTNCRVKFDHNIKNPCKVLPARCIAYHEPCTVRMTIGTRVLALFKDSNRKESFYSGVVAEIPNPVNTYRYLVFFDDGYAQYVKHKDTRLVCESKSTVWEEVHPFIRDFVKDYLLKYPERPMVRLHAGQRLNTEWNGKWWTSKVLQVDASLAYVHFEEDDRTEWIYRGSTRLAPLYLELQAAGRSRTRLPRSKAQFRTNMPYVEYMRSEEQTKLQQQLQQEEMIRRQRAVAKKSVTLPQPTPMVDKPDNVTSRVVYYTPKNAIKPYKMVPHTCGPQCKRTDVLSLKELRTYNPLAKPLLSGWERMQVRFKGSKHIMYRAPCGRRIRDMGELHRYLRTTQSDFPVDLFDFNVNTHCLAEFVLHKYNVMKKDLSHGKESVPVPCVNYCDDSLPEFCSYNTERTPTAGVPLNLDPDFLCGCDCEDDCMDKSKCACWKMTLEGARTIGLDSPNVGYVYRRLPEPLPSGIYECNSRCKCKSTCLNRVAQHPLQLKLQVFKTLKRGWGIRALNDVPKGSFLCVYAGNLLTDATANLDGLNEGDEYLAELDYIEVVEQMKEGFEEDIPDADKKLDKKESKQPSSEDEETESEEDNRESDKNDKEDGDFQPGYIGLGLTEFSKRLRKRCKKKQNDEQSNKENSTDKQKTDDCITISDDEEVREPSRFTAQAGMGDKGFISKYSSVRTLFGRDEACYIMDAKVQGNIGRYLNHSCCPNVFVQNVFVDTHDPRFPWVAFFALSHIRAGTELTWNYNYDIGSVPGKILYCYCGAHNCRGRLL